MSDWNAYPAVTTAPQADPWAAYPTERRGVTAKGGPGGGAKAPAGSAHISNLVPLSQATAVASPGSGSPVQQAMAAQSGPLTPIDDPTMLPKIEATAIASLPKDPRSKALYLAKKIFPDMTPNEALKRIGFDGGRLYYVANDGKPYYAEPSFSAAAPMRTLAETPDLLASGIGPALPTVGGMIGGIAGGPDPASIATAAGGGMLGDSIRQAGAQLLTGEQKSPIDAYAELFGEGAAQGASQALGLGAAKGAGALFNRNPLKVAGYDIATLTPARIAEAQKNTDLAKGMGVSVTPGEAGNVQSLLINQRQLGRQPEATNIMADFYKNRNINEIPDAWTKYLDTVSPQANAAVANRDLGAAAKASIDTAKAARKDAATPIYKSIMRPDNALSNSDFMALLDKNPVFATAIQAVRKDKMLAPLVEGMPDSSLPVLDLAKRYLDGQAGVFNKAGDATRAGVASTAASDLRDALDPLFPMYKNARDAFAGKSPEVRALEKGIVGLVAKDKPNALQNLPKTLLSSTSSDPYSINQAKIAFQKAGQMDKWDAATRSFLQNSFDDAVKAGGKAGPAYQIWKSIAGDTKQLANMKAALGPTQFQGLQDFLKVQEMISRALAEGSPTATDTGSRASFAGGMAKGTAAAVRGVNPLEWPNRIADKILDSSAGGNIKAVAKAITNPDAVKSLRRLRILPPSGKAFVKELGYLGSLLGWDKVQPMVNRQAPMAPGTIPAEGQ
jgi:hypothetical protein